MSKPLSPKHQRFVAEYLKDQNAKQAAIRAGYSRKVAETNGPRLLRNAQVKAAISAKLEKVQEKAGISAEWILRSLKNVAERCMTDVPVMEFDHAEKEMVEKKTWVEDPEKPGKLKMVGVYEFDSNGANRALELLGKNQKLFTDKVEMRVTHSLAERMKESRKRAQVGVPGIPAGKPLVLNGHQNGNGNGHANGHNGNGNGAHR